MKIAVVGKEKELLEKYIRKNYPDFKFVKKNPELIIGYGGDGTLLFSERLYPGVPKVLIRNSQVCNRCSRYAKDSILKLLLKRKFGIKEELKLEGKVKNKKIIGLNDIILIHEHYNKALRFNMTLNNKLYGREFLGDGLVVSTPLGSTGYYQSITRSNFYKGLGIAFNNTINIIGHLVVDQDSKIMIEVTRGPGLMVNDNNDKFIKVDTGDKIYIQKTKEKARIITFKEKYNRFNIDVSQNRFPLGYCQICHCKL